MTTITNPGAIQRLPLDVSGVHPDNLVKLEPHEVTKTKRFFMLQYGAFYTDSLVLTYNDIELTSTQYEYTRMHAEAVEETGKNVAMMIYIKDTDVVGTIRVNYQAVGGVYQDLSEKTAAFINAYETDMRGIHYTDIIDIPESFWPHRHLHHLDDVYGWGPFYNLIAEYIALQQQQTNKQLSPLWIKYRELANWKLSWKDITADDVIALQGEVTELRGLIGTEKLASVTYVDGLVNELSTRITNNTNNISNVTNGLTALAREFKDLYTLWKDKEKVDDARHTAISNELARVPVHAIVYGEELGEDTSWITMINNGKNGHTLTVGYPTLLTKAVNDISTINGSLLEINKLIDINTSSINTINTDISAINSKITTLTNKDTELKNEIDRLATTVNNNYSELTLSIATSKSSLNDEIDTKLNNLSSSLNTSIDNVETLAKGYNDSLNTRINTVESTSNTVESNLQTQINTLTTKVSDQKSYTDSQVSSLKETLEEKINEATTSASSDSTTKYNDINSRLTIEEKVNDTQDTQISGLTVSTTANKEAIDATKTALDTLTPRVAYLESKLTDKYYTLSFMNDKLTWSLVHDNTYSITTPDSRTMSTELLIYPITKTTGAIDKDELYTLDLLSTEDYSATTKNKLVDLTMKQSYLCVMYIKSDYALPILTTEEEENKFIEENFPIYRYWSTQNKLNLAQIRNILRGFLRGCCTGYSATLLLSVSGLNIDDLSASVNYTGVEYRHTLKIGAIYAKDTTDIKYRAEFFEDAMIALQYNAIVHNLLNDTGLRDNHFNYFVNPDMTVKNNEISGWHVLHNGTGNHLSSSTLSNLFLGRQSGMFNLNIIQNTSWLNDKIIDISNEDQSRYLEVTVGVSSAYTHINVYAIPCEASGAITHDALYNTANRRPFTVERSWAEGNFSRYLALNGHGHFRPKWISPDLNQLRQDDLGITHFRVMIEFGTAETNQYGGYPCLTELRDANRYNPPTTEVTEDDILPVLSPLVEQAVNQYIVAQTTDTSTSKWDLSKFVKQPGAEDWSSVTTDDNDNLIAKGVILQDLGDGDGTSVFAPATRILVTESQSWTVPSTMAGRKARIRVRANSVQSDSQYIHSAMRETFITLPSNTRIQITIGEMTSFGNYLTVISTQDYQDAEVHRCYGLSSQAGIVIIDV